MYSESVVSTTNFQNLSILRRGKVRDVYDLGNRLLVIATDRVSAFDVVIDGNKLCTYYWD